MKNILIILLLMVSVSFAQFQSYDVKVVTPKTYADADYIKLVDNFVIGNSSTATMLATGIEQGTIETFFNQLKSIEQFAQKKMNKITDTKEEVAVTVDTENKLKNLVRDKFSLSDALASYIVGKITLYSKSTKNGDFTFYKSAVIQTVK